MNQGDRYLVTKTVPAACPCCKDEFTFVEGTTVEIIAKDRDGTVEVATMCGNYANIDLQYLKFLEPFEDFDEPQE